VGVFCRNTVQCINAAIAKTINGDFYPQNVLYFKARNRKNVKTIKKICPRKRKRVTMEHENKNTTDYYGIDIETNRTGNATSAMPQVRRHSI